MNMFKMDAENLMKKSFFPAWLTLILLFTGSCGELSESMGKITSLSDTLSAAFPELSFGINLTNDEILTISLENSAYNDSSNLAKDSLATEIGKFVSSVWDRKDTLTESYVSFVNHRELMIYESTSRYNVDIHLDTLWTHIVPELPYNDSFPDPSILQTGDIIFQALMSGQGQAVALATKSVYTHCGILFRRGEKIFVLEAVQPVKLTSLDEWIRRGDEAKYAILRLKEADSIITPEVEKKMEEYGSGFLGKDYDLYFGWSDDRIYCSELVWKIYKKTTGLELGALKELRTFDLSSKVVKDKLLERYGKNIPLNEKVISPAEIYASNHLFTLELE